MQRDNFIAAFMMLYVKTRRKWGQGCHSISVRPKVLGFFLVFTSGGLPKPLCLEHGQIFFEKLYTFKGNLKHSLILTDLARSIEIRDSENGHSYQTRYKEFLNPSSPMDNNAGGGFML